MMNISTLTNTTQALNQAQTQRTPSPVTTQNTGNAPVEQRPSSAPQPVNQSQQIAKNVSATENQDELQALNDAAQKISAHLNLKNSSLEFSVDQNSGKNVVKIVDKTTTEVVRQIPSEEAIHIAQALDELDEIRQGLLLSEQG